MMIYMHTVNTSLESNNENDDDVMFVNMACVVIQLQYKCTSKAILV
jgi:hypothetical protein